MNVGGSEFQAGWLDLGIAAVLSEEPSIITSFKYVYVTMLDSSPDVAEIAIGQTLARQFPECARLGVGMVIPGAIIQQVQSKLNLFVGFDEIWCCDVLPAIEKPADISLTTPAVIASQRVPAALTDWMRLVHCQLALGDGIGLNYVASNGRLVERMASIANGDERR